MDGPHLRDRLSAALAPLVEGNPVNFPRRPAPTILFAVPQKRRIQPSRESASSRSHELGVLAGLFICPLAHLVTLVEQLDFLHFLESFLQGAFGLLELELEIRRR